uniref:TAFH domain-containing protein n=1 Tax=Meloidogyne incognita TaxID=6306 RepID=A0A914M7F0_MELIC
MSSNLENPHATTIYYLNQPQRVIQPEKQQNNNVFIVHQQQPPQQQNVQQQNLHFNQNLPPFSSVSMPSTTTIIRSSRSSTQSPQIVSSSASRSSASPALMSSSVDAITAPTEQDIMKCAHFFKSLLKMRPHQLFNLLDMKNLLRDVLLGEQSPEEFTVKLREVTKSQDKGNLLPFLRRSLPSLRRSIQNGQHLDLRQALDIDESCSSSTPQLPQQSDEFTPFSQQQSQNTQQNFQIYGKSLKTENYSPANLATTTTHSMPKSVENIQQNSLDNYKFVRSNEMKYEVSSLKKEELNSVAEKVNVGMDPSASSLFDDNADNLNNLPKMLLNPQALADRILLRMPDAEGVDGEVLSVISNAAEARLCTILAHLSTLAEHRLEPLRANPLYTSIDEPRKQIRFMEDIDKRAHNHRQTAEKEALLKITKSKGKDKDALEKAKQIQKADREAMVNREANAAAFAALGGSRIGAKRPFAAPNLGGTVDWKSGMQNQGLTSGLTGAAKIARLKRVTMRDLQFFLGIDPSIPSNSRLRHRIALYSLCADENTLI